ncbi:MAG TPA: Crp/Fnr family transcriptional regulator [Steroidobacteraceae bacterium]|nr:Crp/Fnr family transcriptional regulator [Steroidobacteraceae bacterium]
MQSDGALARELRHHYLFAALSDAQRERLLASAVGRAFAEGEQLFGHGDAAACFFLLRRGCVKLYRLSPEGDEKIMRLIRPSQTFAESVLFMEAPRYPVHGEGVEAGELIAFDRETFLGILRESFATCCAVMAQMALRIQAHWDEIETLALQNSRYRVVHYLLGLLPPGAEGRVTVTLPARKMVIAAHVAVTPETLSRTLRSLSDERLIEVAGDEVTILDVDRLRRHMH